MMGARSHAGTIEVEEWARPCRVHRQARTHEGVCLMTTEVDVVVIVDRSLLGVWGTRNPMFGHVPAATRLTAFQALKTCAN